MHSKSPFPLIDPTVPLQVLKRPHLLSWQHTPQALCPSILSPSSSSYSSVFKSTADLPLTSFSP